jgi:hypothetical protein
MKKVIVFFGLIAMWVICNGMNVWAVDPIRLQGATPKLDSALKQAPVQTQTVDPNSLKELELLGVEIWVAQGAKESFLPHRKIYAGSQLQPVVYFRNSGIPDVPLQGLTFSVEGPGGNFGGLMANRDDQILRRGEDARVFGRQFTLPAGNHTLLVKIDNSNKILERNEQNNEITIKITVAPTPAGGIPEADCGIQELTPRFNAHPLPWHVGGDTDMKGHGPTVVIEGELVRTDTRIFVRGKVEMYEGDENSSHGDGTDFEYPFNGVLLFQAPKDCRIKKIEFAGDLKYLRPEEEFGRIVGSLSGSKNWKTLNAARRGAGPQLFQSATCLGDTAGSEKGKIGCNDITLPPLRVYLEKVTGPSCVTRHQLPLQGHSSLRYINRGFVGVFPLSRVRGDAKIDKNKVSGNLASNLVYDRNGVMIVTKVRMEEQGGDWTTYEGAFTDGIFYAPLDAPGCYVRNVARGGYASGDTGLISWVSSKGNRKSFSVGIGSLNGFIKTALCRDDTDGDNEDGKLGCKNIEYAERFLNIDLWPSEVKAPPGPPTIQGPIMQLPVQQQTPNVSPVKQPPRGLLPQRVSPLQQRQ